MAKIRIDGRMTVAQLKDDFQELTGCGLRVYRDLKRHRANDSDRLSNVRIYNAPAQGEIECRLNMNVRKFCERMREFGFEVRVSSPDDWVLADEHLTLGEVSGLQSQTTIKEMEKIANHIISDLKNENLDNVIKDINKNQKNIISQEEEEKVNFLVKFLKIIKCDFDQLINFLDFYQVPSIAGIIGSIITGNPLGLATGTIGFLTKLYKSLGKN